MTSPFILKTVVLSPFNRSKGEPFQQLHPDALSKQQKQLTIHLCIAKERFSVPTKRLFSVTILVKEERR